MSYSCSLRTQALTEAVKRTSIFSNHFVQVGQELHAIYHHKQRQHIWRRHACQKMEICGSCAVMSRVTFSLDTNHVDIDIQGFLDMFRVAAHVHAGSMKPFYDFLPRNSNSRGNESLLNQKRHLTKSSGSVWSNCQKWNHKRQGRYLSLDR